MQKILNVLLAEDDAEDALLFQRRCPAFMQVKHVQDASSALSALRESSFDICFTDYRLGIDSGLDLVRSARAEHLRVPMVVITGQDLESLGENALLAGATDFIAKDGLTTSEIQRVSRWALIRRHVENRREDALGPDLLEQLLGPQPADRGVALPAVDLNRQDLRRVGYISQAIKGFSQQEMFSMCAEFAAANARIHVTGVLVHIGNWFMQIIEGEGIALDVLMKRIQRDQRHKNLALILDEPIAARAFPHWNMGCFNRQDKVELSPSVLDNVLKRFEQVLSMHSGTRQGFKTLIGTLPELLTRQARYTSALDE
jgi:CheY-like chemotaxis protein